MLLIYPYRQAARLFDHDVEEQLEFMELYGFRAAKTSLYKNVGNFEAAGELHQQAGEVELAVRCFLRSEHRHIRRRAISGVLDQLRSVSFQCQLTDKSIALLRLLDKLSKEDFTSDEDVQVTASSALDNFEADIPYHRLPYFARSLAAMPHSSSFWQNSMRITTTIVSSAKTSHCSAPRQILTR